MARFRKKPVKPVEIEATQWFKNGDHPNDDCREITGDDGESFLSEGKVVRRFRKPDVYGDESCISCGHIFDDHGWIDREGNEYKVCPGDYIVTGTVEHYRLSRSVFKHEYEPVED